MKVVIGTFPTVQAAELAAVALEQQNYPRGDISVVAAPPAPPPVVDLIDLDAEIRAAARTGAGSGAVAGTTAGAVLGLLAYLGVIAPPGAEPLLAAGPLLTIFTAAGVGAVGGALVGSLIGMMANLGAARVVHPPAEREPGGGALVVVRTEEPDLDTIADTLDDLGATDIDQQFGHHQPPAPPARAPDDLHDERVTVERHPVDRPVGAAATAAFREGTFELHEYREEAVVTRQVRVVEEVVIGREARRPDRAVVERTPARPPTGPMRWRTKILIEPRSPGEDPVKGYSEVAAHRHRNYGGA